MKRIVVATDFSPESQLVLDHAVRLARALGCELRLVHVVSPWVPAAPPPGMPPIISANANAELVELATERLDGMCRALPADVRADRVVAVGPVVDTLLRVAAESDAELLTIGAHGHGRIACALGTTAGRIANHAPLPVFIVRPFPTRAAG